MFITSIQDAEASYRKSRLVFEEGGYRLHARSVYICEKEAQRRAAWQRKAGIYEDGSFFSGEQWLIRGTSWAFLTFVKLTCNYGESVRRALIWMLGIIVIFSVAYYPNPWGWGFIELRGMEWSTSRLSIHNIVTSVYFSIVTFATLGYGDICPANDWARVCICIEVISGYAMFGIVLVLLARKLTYS